MKHKDALEITITFAQLLKVDLNPLILKQQFKSIDEADSNHPKEFFNQLNEIGKYSSILFMDNQVEEDVFIQMLDEQILPLLVFSPRNNTYIPIVIESFALGQAECHVFEDDERKKYKYSVRELISKLKQEEIRPGKPELSKIYLISPLVINPLVSPKQDGSDEIKEGKDKNQHKVASPIKRLFNLLYNDRRDIGYIYVYALVIGLLSLTTPLAVQAIIGLISGGLILEPVVVLISFVIFATIVSGALQIMQVRMVEVIKQKLFAKAAFEFAFRVPLMKIEAIRKEYAPELVNRFFDVITIQKSYTKLFTDILAAVLQILFGLILLTFYHPFFVFFSIALLLILFLIFRFTGPKGLKSNILESKYKYKVVYWLEEVARTLSTFKLAGYTNLSLERTDVEVMNYLKKRQTHFNVLITQYIGIVFFKVVVTAGILILGSILVIENQITLGQFVAADIVIITVLGAVEKIILSLDSVYDLLTAVDKVGHITDIPLDKTGGISLPKGSKGFEIKIRNLCYRYPDAEKDILKNISLDIEAGERVGIVGEAGSGKTTFINVITGLLESYKGIIAYNGLSLRDINITSLRDEVGDNLTSQDIFDGTLAENITVGKKNVLNEDILRALEKVGLMEYMQSLPDGLQTKLVSGGQQLPTTVVRKIILARSIAECPRLLVFDDFFLNMSNSFKQELTRYLFDKDNPWTLITITHNPQILEKCDKVLIMKDGHLVKAAKFNDLVYDPLFLDLIPYFPYKK